MPHTQDRAAASKVQERLRDDGSGNWREGSKGGEEGPASAVMASRICFWRLRGLCAVVWSF